MSERTRDPTTDSFVYTLRAAVYTLLISLPWPVTHLVVGLTLVSSLEASDHVKALGNAFIGTTEALAFLRTLRVVCRDDGLAVAHFGWSRDGVQALRVQLDQLLLTFLLPAFVLLDAFERQPAEYGGEIGRIAFVVASAGLTVFLVRLLRPETGIVRRLRLEELDRDQPVSSVWIALAVALPLSLIVAALAGYLYSATSLMGWLIDSLWMVAALVVLHAFAVRWLSIVKKRAWVRATQERREAERQAGAEGGASSLPTPPEDPGLDVGAIDADTRRLLNIGLVILGLVFLSAIWSSALPALGILEEVELWERVDQVGGEAEITVVSLGDLGVALLLGFLAFFAARSLPPLLEVLLKQRGTEPGSRLAFATLARYLIVLIGVGLVAQSIGFSWNNIQWLVAALGVGIGFGLQEIVANFISGLIILVERPVRVGDIVTVGDTSGVVSRLQIRATTVTNFDRQELLVPNKEFVTNRVLNWSLSDEIIRIILRVGVEYGTDLRKTMQLIQGVLEAEERVLEEPKPVVLFEQFGDNSLNLSARAFIRSSNSRLEIMSALNLEIKDVLAEAGIVVAFPQRDVHLDTSSALDIRVLHEALDQKDESKA